MAALNKPTCASFSKTAGSLAEIPSLTRKKTKNVSAECHFVLTSSVESLIDENLQQKKCLSCFLSFFLCTMGHGEKSRKQEVDGK